VARLSMAEDFPVALTAGSLRALRVGMTVERADA
jgi:hypothetical protein